MILAPLLIIAFSALLIGVLVWERFDKTHEQKDSWLVEARQEANQIITQAETEGLKITSEAKVDKQVYQDELNKKISQGMDQALVEFRNYLSKLQNSSVSSESQMEEVFKSRINTLLLNLEQNLSSFLTSSEQKSLEAVNLELKSARQLIDTYRSEQLALIDENIVAVLERTLSLVLRNKLTLSDQMDLVYEALEKAKVEKFFV